MAESLPQRRVPFYGDDLVAVQQSDGTIYVLFARLCGNLGLNQQAQARRIQRHVVLQKGLVSFSVETDGGVQTAQCLKLSLLPLWLSGVQASRVKPELQRRLVLYQEEAADVLWQAFKSQILVEETAITSAHDQRAMQQLQHIAELGRAITHMAEQQIELQRQQQALAGRVDVAARVVREVQDHLAGVQVRLGLLEDQLGPADFIVEAEATAVSNQVKALGELLTTKEQGKNQYQSIFAELYRRFGVSSY